MHQGSLESTSLLKSLKTKINNKFNSYKDVKGISPKLGLLFTLISVINKYLRPALYRRDKINISFYHPNRKYDKDLLLFKDIITKIVPAFLRYEKVEKTRTKIFFSQRLRDRCKNL